MKLLIRIAVFILVGIGFLALLSYTNPCYTINDLYLVSGHCSDVHLERIYAKNGTERVYIVMDDGEKYYIYDSLWEKLNEEQKNIKGSEISFFASDKGKHWVYDHLFIAFGSDKDDCTDSMKLINKKHIETQVIMLSVYFVGAFFAFIVPEILRELERREKTKKKKDK